MQNKIIKTLIFMAVWLLSFTCGIYLYGAIFIGNELSEIDTVLNVCGFTLSILWMWFNTVYNKGE